MPGFDQYKSRLREDVHKSEKAPYLDICRISIDPSDHPVYETKGGEQVFWWRTPVSTDAVRDEAERDLLIARRWGA